MKCYNFCPNFVTACLKSPALALKSFLENHGWAAWYCLYFSVLDINTSVWECIHSRSTQNHLSPWLTLFAMITILNLTTSLKTRLSSHAPANMNPNGNNQPPPTRHFILAPTGVWNSFYPWRAKGCWHLLLKKVELWQIATFYHGLTFSISGSLIKTWKIPDLLYSQWLQLWIYLENQPMVHIYLCSGLGWVGA